MNTTRPPAGQVLLEVMVFSAVAVVFITGLVGWAIFQIKASRQTQNREQAVEIAEAGIEYYRWHLAHAPVDYKDGTAVAGPYVHSYKDSSGNVIGSFTLDIIPPPISSTIVTITSTGKVTADPKLDEKIQVQLAIPSLAKFAVAANSDIRFGAGTEVFGPIHSNGGVHFDGLAHNIVSSTQSQYTDPDTDDLSFGVHTDLSPSDPSPPATVPTRTDVFETGRQFPLPAIDFAGFTSDLSQIKASAISAGRYFANSGYSGYRITLKTDDTFDIYKVKSLFPAPSNCTNVTSQNGWGTWSIGTGGTAVSFVGNYAIPANGLIFVEDHVWVEGTINTARVTIASGRFPDNSSTRTSITINNDLRYTNYDGRDVIALIAQQDINVGLVSADTLRIDAALIAQNGRAGRFYYKQPSGSSNCSPYDSRTSLTLYGMIATNVRYGFAYTDGSGYDIRNITYDANLLYSPPPSFPLTSSQYTTVSWKRVN